MHPRQIIRNLAKNRQAQTSTTQLINKALNIGSAFAGAYFAYNHLGGKELMQAKVEQVRAVAEAQKMQNQLWGDVHDAAVPAIRLFTLGMKALTPQDELTKKELEALNTAKLALETAIKAEANRSLQKK